MFVFSFASSNTFIESFVPHCTMIRLFFSLTIISIVIVSIWSSDGYTVHNSLLTGHVFKTIESIDWFQCVEECHKLDECISYNYFPPKKVCELNNFGYDNQCEAGTNFIRATGWIHHVLDISEVITHANMGYYRHLSVVRLSEKTVLCLTFGGDQQKKFSEKRMRFSLCHWILFKGSKGLLRKVIHH